MTAKFDLIVIGGGSGGIAAARRASEYGARVLLAEYGPLGGTCVNVGCVPKKVMWTTSQINETLDLAGSYGFDIERRGFDWSLIKQSRDVYVRRLNGIYGRNLDHSGVTLVRGKASFRSAKRIGVNGDEYLGDHILIAVGGRPSVPDIPGASLGITSDGFFELEKQPENILIIGAGYIATEFAGLLHGLGSKVTMLLRKDRLLRTFDHDIHQKVMEDMRASGIGLLTDVDLQSLTDENHTLGYRDSGGAGKDGYDCIIWAVGRHPNLAGLNLGAAGVETDRRGFVPVDDFQNTPVPGIYAVGDVTPRAQLTPVAIAAGRRLSDRLFNNQPDSRLDYENIPTVIFSHPPVGTVGLSEADALERYGESEIRIYRNTFVDMRFAIGEHKPRTLVKLVVQGRNEKVVGCHVAGHAADEMIQGFAVAMKMGATKEDFDRTVAIHPTAAEELVTLR
ncbi:MAG: glutathione-disulfide reductase [Gammaproteobacteria bacterium]|nr:glutathione-disulfide reductase [Gammaproteobacteria bacterium]